MVRDVLKPAFELSNTHLISPPSLVMSAARFFMASLVVFLQAGLTGGADRQTEDYCDMQSFGEPACMVNSWNLFSHFDASISNPVRGFHRL